MPEPSSVDVSAVLQPGSPRPRVTSLAHALRSERRQRQWRQVDLADHLGVTQQTVARWEAGDPPQRRLHAPIAAFIGLTEESFRELLAEPIGPPPAKVVRLELRAKEIRALGRAMKSSDQKVANGSSLLCSVESSLVFRSEKTR